MVVLEEQLAVVIWMPDEAVAGAVALVKRRVEFVVALFVSFVVASLVMAVVAAVV